MLMGYKRNSLHDDEGARPVEHILHHFIKSDFLPRYDSETPWHERKLESVDQALAATPTMSSTAEHAIVAIAATGTVSPAEGEPQQPRAMFGTTCDSRGAEARGSLGWGGERKSLVQKAGAERMDRVRRQSVQVGPDMCCSLSLGIPIAIEHFDGVLSVTTLKSASTRPTPVSDNTRATRSHALQIHQMLNEMKQMNDTEGTRDHWLALLSRRTLVQVACRAVRKSRVALD